MSTNATKFKTLYANSTATPQAIVNGTENNVIVVSGMNSNGILKFEVSVDGGTTWVEDESLQFEANGTVTLERINAMIRAKDTGVTNKANVKAQLGY
jgi:hypothetical protein